MTEILPKPLLGQARNNYLGLEIWRGATFEMHTVLGGEALREKGVGFFLLSGFFGFWLYQKFRWVCL